MATSSDDEEERGVFAPGIFKGKVVFCTGGRSGICRSIVRKLLSLGASVTIVGRNADLNNLAARDLSSITGSACLAQTADVRRPAELARAVEATVKSFGGIDFVVCGAAGNFLAPIEGLSANAFKTVIDIDLMGTFNTIKATMAEVKKRRGAYISISATLHYQGVPYQAHVSAAKAAVDALSQVLAVELGPFGVRSNIVAPGPIAGTEGMGRLSQGKPFDQAEIPLGKQGEPADIAGMCAFLFSREGEWVTGQVFVVDGGARHTQTGLVPYPAAVLEPIQFQNQGARPEKTQAKL